MRGTLCLLAAGCWTLGEPASHYELRVRGAVESAARGAAESSPAGTVEDPYFTITLGGPEGGAAAVFTRPGWTTPPVGVYPVRESEFPRGAFSAQIITGVPAHPTGVFRVQRGTLTITAAATDRLSGRFELEASGFLTDSPANGHRQITATGRFTARSREPDPAAARNR